MSDETTTPETAPIEAAPVTTTPAPEAVPVETQAVATPEAAPVVAVEAVPVVPTPVAAPTAAVAPVSEAAPIAPVIQEASTVSGTLVQTAAPAAPIQNPQVEAIANPGTVAPQYVADVSTFDGFIGNVDRNGSDLAKGTVSFLQSYVTSMDILKAQSDVTLVATQQAFWKNIYNVINTNTDQFTEAWTVISAFFRQYRTTVFSERYIYRGVPKFSITAADRQAFVNTMAILMAAAGLTNKKDVVKVIDLTKALSSQKFSEANRQRIVNYYIS